MAANDVNFISLGADSFFGNAYPVNQFTFSASSFFGTRGLGNNFFGACVSASSVVQTPPVINNFSPAVGSSIQPSTIINFDIVDPDNFVRVLIVAAYSSGKRDVMHDGNAFAPFYAGSTRTPITGGFTYSFIRSGGWEEDPTITPYAIDVFGAENL